MKNFNKLFVLALCAGIVSTSLFGMNNPQVVLMDVDGAQEVVQRPVGRKVPKAVDLDAMRAKRLQKALHEARRRRAAMIAEARGLVQAGDIAEMINNMGLN